MQYVPTYITTTDYDVNCIYVTMYTGRIRVHFSLLYHRGRDRNVPCSVTMNYATNDNHSMFCLSGIHYHRYYDYDISPDNFDYACQYTVFTQKHKDEYKVMREAAEQYISGNKLEMVAIQYEVNYLSMQKNTSESDWHQKHALIVDRLFRQMFSLDTAILL